MGEAEQVWEGGEDPRHRRKAPTGSRRQNRQVGRQKEWARYKNKQGNPTHLHPTKKYKSNPSTRQQNKVRQAATQNKVQGGGGAGTRVVYTRSAVIHGNKC